MTTRNTYHFEAGLARLGNLLPPANRPEFEVLSARLREVLQDQAMYGADPVSNQAKWADVAQLDSLCRKVWGLKTANTFTALAQWENGSLVGEPMIRIEFEAGLDRLADLLPAEARPEFEILEEHLRKVLRDLRLYGSDPGTEEVKWDVVRELNALTYRLWGPDTVKAFTVLCQEKEGDFDLLMSGIVNAYIKGQK